MKKSSLALRPLNAAASLASKADRQKVEDSYEQMVRRIEADPVVADRIASLVRPEFERAGLTPIVDDGEWPPIASPTADQVFGSMDWNLEDFKVVQKKRYLRQIYENAVRREGVRLMLLEGWRPWNHCLIPSAETRKAIVFLFLMYVLRQSVEFCSLPKDVLFMIFTRCIDR